MEGKFPDKDTSELLTVGLKRCRTPTSMIDNFHHFVLFAMTLRAAESEQDKGRLQRIYFGRCDPTRPACRSGSLRR
jgi:hypothetical protein